MKDFRLTEENLEPIMNKLKESLPDGIRVVSVLFEQDHEEDGQVSIRGWTLYTALEPLTKIARDLLDGGN